MSDKPNNPSASTGLTIRDYFAAKAMQAIMWHNATNVMNGLEGCTYDENSEDAYRQADSMLKQREL